MISIAQISRGLKRLAIVGFGAWLLFCAYWTVDDYFAFSASQIGSMRADHANCIEQAKGIYTNEAILLGRPFEQKTVEQCEKEKLLREARNERNLREHVKTTSLPLFGALLLLYPIGLLILWIAYRILVWIVKGFQA